MILVISCVGNAVTQGKASSEFLRLLTESLSRQGHLGAFVHLSLTVRGRTQRDRLVGLFLIFIYVFGCTGS